MADGRDAPKSERFAEFQWRLLVAPSASGFAEAYRQISDTLNAVEDELTSIPPDPTKWRTDGRMYPPQLDSLRSVAGRADVKRLVSKGHNTLIGDNGAIEIRELSGRTVLSKLGADGRGI